MQVRRTFFEMDKPSPVPPNSRAVLGSAWRNGSKSVGKTVGSMPMPVSRISNRITTRLSSSYSWLQAKVTEPVGRFGTVSIGHKSRWNQTPLTRLGELDGIAEAVGEDLAQTEAVAEERPLVERLNVFDKLESLLLSDDAEKASVVERFCDQERARFERESVLFDFAQVEDRADQFQQSVGAPHCLLNQRALILAQPARVVQQEFADAEDAGDRGPDLVRDGRQELRLEAVCFARGVLRSGALLQRHLGFDELGHVRTDDDAARDGVGVRVDLRNRRVAAEGDELAGAVVVSCADADVRVRRLALTRQRW